MYIYRKSILGHIIILCFFFKEGKMSPEHQYKRLLKMYTHPPPYP